MKDKRTLSRTSLSLAAAAALGMAPALAGAAGFALIEQNASGMGNAYAGAAAIAEDASTIFFNPAGMGMLPGAQVAIAGHAVSVNADFSNTGCTVSATGGCALPPLGSGLPVGATTNNAGDTVFIPNAYFALPIGERFAFGVGINAPFGLKTEYDDPWIGRFQGIKSELTTVNINPAVSFKVTDKFILGLGVNYQKADAELTNAVVLGLNTEGRAKVDVDDDAWGWNVGALFKLGDDMRLGVSYRSKIEYTLEGTTTVTSSTGTVLNALGGATEIDVTFPDMASLSVVQDFGPKWQLLGDVTWTHWSEIKTLTAINPNAAAGANIRDQLAFDFDDAWRLSLGLNYRSSERWMWRGGIAWDQSPVQDAESRTVRLPDEDRYWLALGAKWNATKSLAFDFGYSHLFIDDPEVNFTRAQLSPTGSGVAVPPTSTTVRGTYDSSVDIFSVQLTYTF